MSETTSNEFQFSKEQALQLKETIKAYFHNELDTEIGDLQAELFLDFLNQNVGKHYYNLGVTDTLAAIKDRTEDLIMLIKSWI